METYALHLTQAEWHYIGGTAEGKKPVELVLRSYDQDVEFATGSGKSAPDADALLVPAGEGRRLEGQHFFVRPTTPGAACRIAHRGLVE